ncbi:hypothetical protein GCM10022243_29130 [Saccharothrix violaceirubra]
MVTGCADRLRTVRTRLVNSLLVVALLGVGTAGYFVLSAEAAGRGSRRTTRCCGTRAGRST